jgi:LacI family transcriptional regulator, gluconate utilization system Gnt-I transcriptional repressor
MAASTRSAARKSKRRSGKTPAGNDGTLHEVANAAGVSSATVSRYFNSPDLLSSKTASRVKEAVQSLNYVPNLLAGGLASNRTRLIATVIPTIAQSIFSNTMQAITDTLADGGYSVMLGLTGARDEHVDRQLLAIIGRRPDGIILTGPTLQSNARARLKETGIPTIETWDLPADPIDLVVGFSHDAVGHVLAKHVLSRGRRRAFIVSATGVRALARRYSFSRAMLEGGAQEPEVATFDGPSTYRHGRNAVAKHLSSGGKPDVIVCSSDWSAHGVLDELRSRNIRVPQDVAVIGFGDLDFASELQPSLTTVKIDGTVIGKQAAQFLMLRAQGKPIKNPVVDIGFNLMVRESG